ncbi:hypothetical protein J2Z72_001100 [Peptostreptococcus canis]|nr:hypothetical protein [Peptostreptococcus canis]
MWNFRINIDCDVIILDNIVKFIGGNVCLMKK